MAEGTLQKSCSNGAITDSPTEGRGVTVTPAVDVLERDGDILVYADLPGVSPEHVDVRFENGELTVHGKRVPSRFGKDEVTHYFRSFRISEQVAADKIEADLRNGRLTLKLPKIEAVKPRKITVNG